MRVMQLVATAVLTLGTITACSSATTTTTPTPTSAAASTATSTSAAAQSQVCASRAQLSSSWNQLVADVRSGNFGDAMAQLQAVKAELSAVADGVSGLASEKKAAVVPQLKALQATVQNLTKATSLSQVRAGVATAQQQLTGVLQTLGTQADCPATPSS